MKHTVYSIGYSGFPHEELVAAIQSRGLLVADLRLKPFSRFQPHWNMKALAQVLGDLYVWVPALGNLNYKGGPTALQDEETGLKQLRRYLDTRDVGVLCTCADVARCHRTVVTDRLAAEGYGVERLLPSNPSGSATRRASVAQPAESLLF